MMIASDFPGPHGSTMSDSMLSGDTAYGVSSVIDKFVPAIAWTSEAEVGIVDCGEREAKENVTLRRPAEYTVITIVSLLN